MAGIRAQYFEDLEDVARKTKQQSSNTPGEKLYKMLVGDEEALDGLSAGEWEKIKAGKYGSRLVIGKTSKGHKISVAPRLIGGTKLATMGYTLEGNSAWSDFSSSSQDYILMHPDLDVSLWTDETAQKQLFGQFNREEGEAHHSRWLARVWRHVFPEAEIEGDSGSMSISSANKRQRTRREGHAQAGASTSTGGGRSTSIANKRQRTEREEQAQAGPSTSTGGGRSSHGVQMKDSTATTYKGPEPEADLLDSSDDDDPNAEKQGVYQALLGRYGLSSATDLWEAFNEDSRRFRLQDEGMLRLLQRGYMATMESISSPDIKTLDRSRFEQATNPATSITDTVSFKTWERRMQGGCPGRIGFIKCPSLFALAKERAEEEKKKKGEEEKGTSEDPAGTTENPDGGEEDEETVRILSESDEEFMREQAAVAGLRFRINTLVSKSDLKAFKELIRAGIDSKGGK
ncbi:hypothetical protein KC345_g4127 [Hortaea werneckii]|nr:hypothetical protein KC345_g4127 [Hortaea werneckii]